jgi:hypothetical protein
MGSVAANPTINDLGRQEALLLSTGIRSSEVHVLAGILNDFRSKFDTLSGLYNAKATDADNAGQSYDTARFLIPANTLVASTHANIKETLGQDSITAFERYIQSFKKGISMNEGVN